jgi:ABC-type transport system involved in cytochrome bd biosynthesis fused ATPase/permease subunit
MVAMRTLLAAACASMLVSAQGKPLISKDLIYDTYGMLEEACSTAYKKAGVDAAIAKVQEVPQVKELKAVVDKQVEVAMKAVPPEVTKGMDEAKVKALQVKATLLEYADIAQTKADEGVAAVVQKLETFVPALKGSIGTGVVDFVIFLVYVCIVLYVSLKIALFVLGTAMSIFCFCCCCGCCCRKKAKAEEPKAKDPKGKAKAKK